jgi:allophanate hydrolase
MSNPVTQVAVVGAHLSGQPLNHQLTNREATLLLTTKTAPIYKLYALRGTTPPKPALVKLNNPEAGYAIEVEVWEIAIAKFGEFVVEVPTPLGIGTTVLENGEMVKGFICENWAIADALDISSFGGWRAYLKSLEIKNK